MTRKRQKILLEPGAWEGSCGTLIRRLLDDVIRRRKRKYAPGDRDEFAGADGEEIRGAGDVGGNEDLGGEPEEKGSYDREDTGDEICGGGEYYEVY